MKSEHIEKLVSQFEKPAMKSKKFKAFLFMELLLGGLAVVALVTQPDLGWPLATFMSLIVVTMGAIALAFNGYQASLDKYFRGAALLGGGAGDAMNKLMGKGDKGKRTAPSGKDSEQHGDESDDDIDSKEA